MNEKFCLENLIKKCVEGDMLSWDVFIKTYEGIVAKGVKYKLKQYGLYILNDEFRDIVQEVFLLIWGKNKLKTVTKIESFNKWLFRIAMNVTANYCRDNKFFQEKKKVSLHAPLTEVHSECLVEDFVLDPKTIRDTYLEDKEIKEIIKQEINLLSEKQRKALILNLYDAKKEREISAIMDISKTTVSTIISRAKHKICEKVEKYVNQKF
ncbi:RNA polymerase sigma-70 domain protein [Candidatus Omnitrophus magneticus]|uniref:RNA polymerase sigma-70 domain protein n=1 Tax=Candidatus Omnitrophus magneticus TaxID=1609969 RepID=A0A0F0CQP2_9BACT|nr:RNA polymerase sigma-70 domain protein [Candidatus Omnitrophus magneticus]